MIENSILRGRSWIEKKRNGDEGTREGRQWEMTKRETDVKEKEMERQWEVKKKYLK